MVGSHRSGEALLFYRIEIKIIACDFPNKKTKSIAYPKSIFSVSFSKILAYIQLKSKVDPFLVRIGHIDISTFQHFLESFFVDFILHFQLLISSEMKIGSQQIRRHKEPGQSQ